jgi:hypothetical protein
MTDLRNLIREEIVSIVKEQDKFWMGTVSDNDDFGKPIVDTFIDGKTTMGPWANMNPDSFKQHGVGLGMGKGQLYRKQPDGKWKKIEDSKLEELKLTEISNSTDTLAEKYRDDKEEYIAYNESYWQWEYDTDIVHAFLYLDKTAALGTGNLRLVMIREHIKSGIGKGTRYNEELNENVGTQDKPALQVIKGYLKQNGHDRTRAGYPFKKLWKNPLENYEEETLINIIKTLHESTASKKAKKLGLVHVGFGNYSAEVGAPSKYKTVDGKLRKVGAKGPKKQIAYSTATKKKDDTKKEKEKPKNGIRNLRRVSGEKFTYEFDKDGRKYKFTLNKQEQKSKASIMTIVKSRLDKKEKREKTKQFQQGKPVSVDKK